MKKLIIPCTIVLFLLSGCYDEIEPDNIAYVTAVGIDASEDEDLYNYTIQFAKTAQISGGASEEGGKGGDIVENIIIQAPNLYTAINWGNHTVSKNLSMAHIKLFVFSDEVARKGVRNHTETIVRSQEIRPNIYFAVSKEKASDYLTNVKPVIEINPAKYYQLVFEQNNYGGMPRNESYDFIMYEDTVYKQNVLPVVGVAKEEKKQEGQQDGENQMPEMGGMSEDKQESGGGEESKSIKNSNQKNAPVNESDFEYKSKNYMAGEIGVEIKNKSEAIGMAVFKSDRLIGYMGSIDSMIYNILTGNYKRGYLTFRIDGVDIPMTIKAETEEKPHIIYDKKQNKALIKLSIEGDFVSMSPNGNTEEIIEKFEKQASEDLNEAAENFLRRTRDEFNSDIVGIGIKSKGLFLNEKEYENFDFKKKYETMDFEVNSSIKVRRTGLTARE